MTVNASDLHDNVVTVPQRLGIFENVIGFEPKSAPTGTSTCALWLEGVRPYPMGSGLAASTGVITFTARVYIPMLSEPLDGVEKSILAAVDGLLTAYSGDFTLDASVRNVDLLGASGQALSARCGYTNIDGVLFRTATITIPLVVNDLWTETA